MGVIYQIRNKTNGKVYIGSTRNKTQRKATHFYFLRKRKHYNEHLQRSFARNPDAFIWEVLEDNVPVESLHDRENAWLDKLKTETGAFDKSRTYNVSIDANRPAITPELRERLSKKYTGEGNPFYGKQHTEEARRKMSESHKGYVYTDEHREKIRQTSTGRKWTPAQRDVMLAVHLGKKRSPETRQKIAAKARGRKCSPAQLEALANGRGRPHSPETRQKISESHRGRKYLPATPAQLEALAKGRAKRCNKDEVIV